MNRSIERRRLAMPTFVVLTLAVGVLAGNALFGPRASADPLAAAVARAKGIVADDSISVASIRRDLSWLASDDRQGRGILTPGLDASADYIAERFKAMGLQPAPGMDGYLQPFDQPFGRELVEDETSLSSQGVGDLNVGEDFSPLAWSKAGDFEGELAFGGYAINSERYAYNDFADVNVQGKVVLALRYEPHNAEGGSRFTGEPRFSREAALFMKARRAEAAGAVALLLVDPPEHHEADGELMDFGSGRVTAEIPVFHITRGTAARLLRASGLPNLETLQREIDAEGKPAARTSRQKRVVSGGFEASERTYPLKNVVGVVPGKRADEYVVVGAHYDHVGLGSYGSSYGYGEVHNGADDNASGTSVLLALAGALAAAEEKPERSIMFVLFTAEEIGLVGSEKFVETPPVPLGQIVAMVNMDMVGRVRDETLFVGGFNASDAYPPILTAADEASPLALSDMGNSFSDRSDHANFQKKGIPAVFFFSGLHEEYHAPADDVELINFEGLVETAALSKRVIEAIAATPRDQLTFNAPKPKEMLESGQPATRPATGRTATTRPTTRPRLGVAMTDATGVTVFQVEPGSPAERAGLRAGDVIERVDGKDVADMASVARAIREAKAGAELRLTVLREGKRIELAATLE